MKAKEDNTKGNTSKHTPRTLLVITYYWPPASGPGVQRILKFVKYLTELGWKIYVITPREGSFPYIDKEMVLEIPEEVVVIKTKTLEPFRIYNFLKSKKGKSVPTGIITDNRKGSWIDRLSLWIRANLFIPDARVGWNRYALKAAKRLIKQQSITRIMTTSPPHSTQLVGLRLKKDLGVKWLADFRDPWVNIFLNQLLPRTASAKVKDQALETSVVEMADQLVVISEGMKAEFEARNDQISVIPNGFDHHDIKKLPDRFATDYFRLGYTGSFKGNQNVIALWRVLAECISDHPEFAEKFQLTLTGRVAEDALTSIRNWIPEKNIDLRGFVSHSEAVDIMARTNLLLFIIPRAEHNNLIVTGKIFEYLATRNPILPIGPVDGDAAKLLESCERELMVDYEDADLIRGQILEQYDRWKGKGISQRTTNDLYLQYSREHLTRKLHKELLKL